MRLSNFLHVLIPLAEKSENSVSGKLTRACVLVLLLLASFDINSKTIPNSRPKLFTSFKQEKLPGQQSSMPCHVAIYQFNNFSQ
ncbi:MAG: hypothetical protein K9H64_16970 [Bacteroidales bacterium]|nr:hypothetical protein [Bacteroidales bacterium]MCF8457674.1 hypothetical protein [Bacteroidales bacterium]